MCLGRPELHITPYLRYRKSIFGVPVAWVTPRQSYIVPAQEAVAEGVTPRQSYIVPAQAGIHSADASRFTQAKSLNVTC